MLNLNEKKKMVNRERTFELKTCKNYYFGCWNANQQHTFQSNCLYFAYNIQHFLPTTELFQVLNLQTKFLKEFNNMLLYSHSGYIIFRKWVWRIRYQQAGFTHHTITDCGYLQLSVADYSIGRPNDSIGNAITIFEPFFGHFFVWINCRLQSKNIIDHVTKTLLSIDY